MEAIGDGLTLWALNSSGAWDSSTEAWEHVHVEDEIGPQAHRPQYSQGETAMDTVLRDAELSLLVVAAAGLPAAGCCCAASTHLGAQTQAVLPSLYAATAPSIYACGGASRSIGVLDTVQRLHVGDDSWEAMPPMPTARRLCAAAVCRGGLYVIGGESHWSTSGALVPFALLRGEGAAAKEYCQLGTVERFWPLRGRWEALPSMPTARAGCAAVACGGLLYALGGRVQEVVQAIAERFDPTINRWERLPAMPSARSGLAATTSGDLVYALGGKGSSGQVQATAECFDPSNGRWWKLPPMLTPRSAFAAGTLSEVIHVAGGFDGSHGVDLCERFDPLQGHWEALAPMSSTRVGGAAAVTHGRLYVFGGKAVGPEASTAGECFCPRSESWIALPSMCQRQVYCAGAAVVSAGSPMLQVQQLARLRHADPDL
mmetsp:Transcript_4509/g.9176  ORF Transcript_4509/g.9176 Transcript_4509/m.9176 type:complete len:429 (-) Transcript_4509:39-1325(-)